MITHNYDIFDLFYKNIKYYKDINYIESIYNYLSKYTKNNTELQLMNSLLNDKNYIKRISDEEFTIYIRIIKEINKEDVIDIVEKIMKETEDIAQINTINRILKYRRIKLIKEENIIEDEITKLCPHCKKECVLNKNTEYVICGYEYKGYDLIGCGKDWCFQCNKKLCKSWNHDNLFIIKNRYHNNKCCKAHSIKTKMNYMEEYCQCNKNKYVIRK